MSIVGTAGYDANLWEMIRARVRLQLEYLRANSAFYRAKFAESGIDVEAIRSLDDFRRLPFTSKGELHEAAEQSPPFGTNLTAPHAAISQIQATSGTSGRPTYIALTERDIGVWNAIIGAAYATVGIRSSERHVHAFALSKGYAGGIPVVRGALAYGLQLVPIGAEAGGERLLAIIADLRPSSIEGAPHFLLHLADRAEKVLGRPLCELGVRTIVTGGEPGGGDERVRAELTRLWGAQVREVFGCSDVAPRCWAECEYGEGMHFVAQDHVLPEILDQASGAILPFEAGVSGELVYTTLDREACPLLRYRQGDVVRVTGMVCGCGWSTPKVRCTGRVDDMMIVRGINLYPAAVRSVLMELRPVTTGRFRIRRDRAGYSTQDAVSITVEAGSGPQAHSADSLARQLETALHERLACRFQVNIVPQGALAPAEGMKERFFDDAGGP